MTPTPDHLRILDPFQTDGLGPHRLEIQTPGRSVRVEVRFSGEGQNVEATIATKEELTPEECAAMVAWCRSRWRAPARIARMIFRISP